MFGNEKPRVNQKRLKQLRHELNAMENQNQNEDSEQSDITDVQIMGKYLLKEIPLFKYEIVIYLIVAVLGFILYVFDRTGIIERAASAALIPAIAAPIIIWVIKWAFFTPKGNRVPTLKAYKSGVIELCVEDISKGYITYGHGERQRRKYITKIAKHTEASTGKPFIITSEIHGENLNLVEKEKPDMKDEEFNAILETEKAVTTKSVMNRMMRFIQPSFTNPMFIVLLATLGLVAILVVKQFGFFGS